MVASAAQTGPGPRESAEARRLAGLSMQLQAIRAVAAAEGALIAWAWRHGLAGSAGNPP